MSYTIDKYELNNGYRGISVVIDKDDDMLAGSFFATEVPNFKEEILQAVEGVLEGTTDDNTIIGNAYGVSIDKEKSIIFDSFDEEAEFELDTQLLKTIILDWIKFHDDNRAWLENK